jgi:hypothetical protein
MYEQRGNSRPKAQLEAIHLTIFCGGNESMATTENLWRLCVRREVAHEVACRKEVRTVRWGDHSSWTLIGRERESKLGI